MATSGRFEKFINKKWNFFKMMLVKLPSISWWGIKLDSLTNKECQVSLKLNWRNQNPFKSVYFAALCGGAELSTGLLCMSETDKLGKWSMLVGHFESDFLKKATGKIRFVCIEGDLLANKLEEIKNSDDKIGTLVLNSIAYNSDNVEVAKFKITWSFKFKAKHV